MFYKSDNRKAALLACGLLLISPFFFVYIDLTESEGLSCLLIASLFLLAFTFYKGKFRYFLLFACFYFAILPATFKQIRVISGESSVNKSIVLTSSIDFLYANGSEQEIEIDERLLINNTPNRLFLEKIVYGEGFFTEDVTQNSIVATIEPYSTYVNSYYIDYYFVEPPSVIEVNNNKKNPSKEKTNRYWLHN
jgi:hypothetical protein